MLLSRRKFAEHVGLSHTRINKLVKDGVIPLHNGKIEPEEGKRLMKANEYPSMDSQREANAKRRKKDSVPIKKDIKEDNNELEEEREKLEKVKKKAEEKGIETDIDVIPTTINEVKIFREWYMGKIAKLDYSKKNGELVNISDVEKDAYELGRILRDNFINLAHKASMRIVGMKKAKDIELFLEKEIEEILEQFSTAKSK